MAEVVLFHHAQGLTRGIVGFADDLRRAGHTVHTPDFYEGRTVRLRRTLLFLKGPDDGDPG